jgi:hypothetical protein
MNNYFLGIAIGIMAVCNLGFAGESKEMGSDDSKRTAATATSAKPAPAKKADEAPRPSGLQIINRMGHLASLYPYFWLKTRYKNPTLGYGMQILSTGLLLTTEGHNTADRWQLLLCSVLLHRVAELSVMRKLKGTHLDRHDLKSWALKTTLFLGAALAAEFGYEHRQQLTKYINKWSVITATLLLYRGRVLVQGGEFDRLTLIEWASNTAALLAAILPGVALISRVPATYRASLSGMRSIRKRAPGIFRSIGNGLRYFITREIQDWDGMPMPSAQPLEE